MLISSSFDQSNQDRRRRIFADRMRTAEKLKRRIDQFLKEQVDGNYSLTQGDKNQIKEVLKL